MGRAPGRGVRPRDGGIRIDFVWRDRRFRQQLDLAPTPANLRYAERVRAEIVEKIRHGTFRFEDYFPKARNARGVSGPATQRDTTFARYAERWIESRGELERATRRGYQSAIDAHLLPAFGLDGRRVDSIPHSEVAAYFGGEWSSAKVRNNVLIVARGIFRMALRDGVIARDPTDGIANQSHQAPEPDPLTREEADAIVAKVRERHGPEADYFEFAFWSGLRTSEVLALRWDDCDLRSGTVFVHHARVGGVEKARTKTHVARRVELTARARAALQRARAASQLADQAKTGGHVFLNATTGEPYPDDQIPRRRWKAGLAAAKLRPRDAYQTRHSFASWMLMAGANPAWLAGQLGHSVEVLLRRYGRWIERADRGAELARVEQALGETALERHGDVARREGRQSSRE